MAHPAEARPGDCIHMVGAPAPKPKKLKTIYRQVDFPTRLLQSESDVDAYVAEVKKSLMQKLSDCDGVRVN